MSNQKTKRRNRNIVSKGKFRKTIIKIIVFLAILWILSLTIKAAASTKTIVIENHAAMANENAPDASQNEQYDPCGLEVVKCPSEEEKAPQNANLDAKTGIDDFIRQTFPENPELAVKMATCESGLVETKVGDGHLAFWHEGELLGRSIGIFQVRTGGSEGGRTWNRAAANGKTVAEFEKWMQDAQENVKYARTIYDRSGQSWTPWMNCARKTGAIK